MLKPFDQVRTLAGRQGVVKAVTGRHVDVVFPEGVETLDIDDLALANLSPVESLVAGELGDTESFALRLQSLYLRHAYRFDDRAGLSNARIEPNLHQIYIAHLVTNKVQPRMILADEVGLGKTIEAGLILKELRARGVADRVLVVCPASLQYQWQTELRTKFNESFEIMDAAAWRYLSHGGKVNPFTERDNIICSLPFAANDRTKPPRPEQILEAEWDLVIFDEAHRVRRSRQGGHKVSTTKAYEMADDLKDLTDGLLLLTATPMQLHPFELYSLIELVEPGMYPNFAAYDRRRTELPELNTLMRSLKTWRTLDEGEKTVVVERHGDRLRSAGGVTEIARLDDDAIREGVMDALVDQHPLAGAMVRNRKAELGGFAGREAKSVLVELTDEELELYEDIATYLREEYNSAVAAKSTAIGFLMVTYQKMLASSSWAIHQSLTRRAAKLRQQLSGKKTTTKAPSAQALEELLDEEEPSTLYEALADVEEGEVRDEALKYEIARIEDLVQRLGKVDDSKASQLLDTLDTIYANNADEKVVIFTQFKATQEHLRRQISANYSVSCFHGGLNAEEKEEAIRRFRSDTQVLISTEAGGEGRNLQFAHVLVNYDLPWNPMKVEQRIGRLDRIGQKRTVFIYNLACAGTIEERVLLVLDQRIQLFTESVGSLDPILGDVETELSSLVMGQIDRFDAVFEHLAEDLGKRARHAQENERLLADFVLDRASLRRDQANALLGEDALATHKDLAAYVEDALAYHGGVLQPHVDGGQVVSLSPNLATRLRVGAGSKRGVFDPIEGLALEDLDFFAMGHPLVEGLLDLGTRTDLDPPVTTARAVPGVSGGPFVEIWYQIRAEGYARFGEIRRHVIGPDLQVHSEEVRSMPVAGRRVAIDLPGWAADAVAASKALADEERTTARDLVQGQWEARQAEELSRAERVHAYRRARLDNRIAAELRWVEEVERSGSERQRKVLPARRGKVAKDRERIELLEAEQRAKLGELDEKTADVSGRVWAAGLVVGL